MRHGYLLRSGEVQTVDFPGALSTGLGWLNASGIFAGRAFFPDLPNRANWVEFVGDRKGNLTPIQFPLELEVVGGINASGVIAATTYSEANGYTGVPILIKDGVVTWLDTPL